MFQVLVLIALFLIVCALAPDIMELIGLVIWTVISAVAFLAFWVATIGLFGYGLLVLVGSV